MPSQNTGPVCAFSRLLNRHGPSSGAVLVDSQAAPLDPRFSVRAAGGGGIAEVLGLLAGYERASLAGVVLVALPETHGDLASLLAMLSRKLGHDAYAVAGRRAIGGHARRRLRFAAGEARMQVKFPLSLWRHRAAVFRVTAAWEIY